MAKLYDINNWYWLVGADATKVYSSLAGDYVPVSDATHQAWRSDGTLPTKIDTEASLGAVLAPGYPSVARPVPAAVLDGYQQAQANDIFQHKLIKFMFVLNNRVRTLEGQQPLTIGQALAYFKGLM